MLTSADRHCDRRVLERLERLREFIPQGVNGPDPKCAPKYWLSKKYVQSKVGNHFTRHSVGWHNVSLRLVVAVYCSCVLATTRIKHHMVSSGKRPHASTISNDPKKLEWPE